jgi:hypothetical protein
MTRQIALGLLLGMPVLLTGHEGHAGKKAVVVGQVVDTACYLGHDSKGVKHVDCATTCAKEGIPLAILEAKTGALFLPIAMDHKNANASLMPFIEKKVKVSGVVMVKGGMKGIVINKVEAVP